VARIARAAALQRAKELRCEVRNDRRFAAPVKVIVCIFVVEPLRLACWLCNQQCLTSTLAGVAA